MNSGRNVFARYPKAIACCSKQCSYVASLIGTKPERLQGELVPTEAELAKAEGRSFESAQELLRRINTNPQSTGGGGAEIKSRVPRQRRSKAFRGEL
jgi:hypothetical protein